MQASHGYRTQASRSTKFAVSLEGDVRYVRWMDGQRNGLGFVYAVAVRFVFFLVDLIYFA